MSFRSVPLGDGAVSHERLVLRQILDCLGDVRTRLRRLERGVASLATDLDELDRARRPFGDGTRPGRRRSRA
jgi:hypothetical protein